MEPLRMKVFVDGVDGPCAVNSDTPCEFTAIGRPSQSNKFFF
jgi:hypothetical protein